jgi:hypothetical protein
MRVLIFSSAFEIHSILLILQQDVTGNGVRASSKVHDIFPHFGQTRKIPENYIPDTF